jgi:hypothetical protein
VGWQPSRFLTDRAEAKRAYALAEQLGSVNAAANQLGPTWPSLRKAFTRHGLGMPAPNPEAVCQRAIAAASAGTSQSATYVAIRTGSSRLATRPSSSRHAPSTWPVAVSRRSWRYAIALLDPWADYRWKKR